MKVTTNLKGQIAMSKAELRAIELGFIPSKPIFDTRYDLILDNSKSLQRIQIKYGDGKMSNSEGAIRVKFEYVDRRKNIYTYRESETDGMIVYLPKIDKLCFLPPEVYVGKRSICIRILPSKNRQRKGILFAKDYLW